MNELMEIEDVVRFLKSRVVHSERRYEQIKENHGEEPHLTHTYYGGESKGYWLGMSIGYDNALEWMLDYIKENNNGFLPENISEIVRDRFE